MSLHEQLLVELDKPLEVWAPPSAALALSAQRRALHAAVWLHAPVTRTADGGGSCCPRCYDDPTWPCETVQVIARELGIEAGEGQ